MPQSRKILSLILAGGGLGAALSLGLPGQAFAAPGDNGDVKIHNSTTAVDDEKDEPKVCVFYLDAFNFDTVQQVSWTIDQQPPTGTAQVLSGSITLTNGTGHTTDQTLPDGHYKLEWTFTGEHGSAKHKVFEVDCASPSPTSSTNGGSPSPSPSGSTSPSPSGSTSPSPSGTPSSSPSPSPSGSTSPSPSSSATTPAGGQSTPPNGGGETPGGGVPSGGVGAGAGGSYRTDDAAQATDTAETVAGATLALAGIAFGGFRLLRRRSAK